MNEEEVKKELFKLVLDGKLAKICYENDDESTFVNSSQIIIKCPCCDKIINYDGDALCQSPQENDNDFLKRKIDYALKENVSIDIYNKVEDNMWAIYKSIEALRGLNRWGGAQIMDRMFTGFNALPSPDQVTSTRISYFSDCVDSKQARQRYLRLAKELHPDLHPESEEEFKEMKRQYESMKW